MPNLQGASPVGRDDGDLLHTTRTISRVLRLIMVVKVDGGAERLDGLRASQCRRLVLGRTKLTESQGVQGHEEASAARAGKHVDERRVTQRDDADRFRSAAGTGRWTVAAAEGDGYAGAG